MSNIHNAIRVLAGTDQIQSAYLVDAEVVGKVDDQNRTVSVQLLSAEKGNTIDARLMASVDDGIFVRPAFGSTVSVLLSEKQNPLIVSFSEIDDITYLGGDYSFVPVVVDKNDSAKGLLKKINNLENALNDVIAKFNAHTHLVSTTGTASTQSGTAASTTTTCTSTITPTTTAADISHTKIKH